MQTENSTKKVYQSPVLKDLGKIGEVTNTGPVQSPNGFDSAGVGSYNS
ncbi:hypothetical protein [Mucilaginibacter koreensis]